MTRIERTYYLVYGLYNLSWSYIGPMYLLFLLGRGLDLFQASMVPAVFFLVSVLFEVPTGAFADVVGRKPAFLASCLLRMLAFGMYAVSHSFAVFIFAEFTDALGATLANGALEAWAVDAMRGDHGAQPSTRFFARAQMIARAAIIVGGLAGGYLAQADMTYPWFAAAATFSLTGCVAIVALSESRADARRGAARSSLLATARAGIVVVRDLPILRLLCLLTLVLAFAIFPAAHLWSPRLQALSGQGMWLMGWIWAVFNLASLIGSALLPRLLAQRRRSVVLTFVTLWRGVMLGVAGWATTFYPALAGLVLLELGFGLSEPILQAWMNEHVASERRATVLSVRTMCLTLGQGSGLLVLGYLARDLGIPAVWMIAAVAVVLIAPAFLLLARRIEDGSVLPALGIDATRPPFQ